MGNNSQSGSLFVVGTPIGNLSDFSKRAVETLRQVDFIAAEDTRVTLKLLNHFDIHTPFISYFEHNAKTRGEQIISRLLQGESCAIVTDAGMPAISDPGQDLVDLALQSGVRVCAVPGPTAFATALAMSGMPSGRFTFEGFLSVNNQSRREHLSSLEDEERTMIFYEAPHKLKRTLDDFCVTFGEDRKIAVVREITKRYEEILRFTLKEAVLHFENQAPKGEFVLIVHGAEKKKETFDLSDAVALARKYQNSGLSISNASKQAAKDTGIKKSEIYKSLLEEDENE